MAPTTKILAALALTVMIAAPASATGATTSPAPGSATGSIGLRLVDAPANGVIDPRAQMYIVDRLAPGAVIHRRIEVSNTSPSTAHIVLYAAAATIENGSFSGAVGRTPDDVSTWTSVEPGVADVPAGGSEMAVVTIAVPSDAAPGERYGVVWAEVRSGPAAGGGIVQVSRVGIRLYLSIGAGEAPASDFTIESLIAERSPEGRPMVLATVRNTGGRALDMSGTLQLLAGPAGLSAGPFPAVLGTTLAIGDREPVTFVLDDQIPAGPWDARITLRSGLLEHDARATITFPDTGAAPPVVAGSLRRGWPYPAMVVVFALGLTIVFVVLRRRRRRSAADRRSPSSRGRPRTVHPRDVHDRRAVDGGPRGRSSVRP